MQRKRGSPQGAHMTPCQTALGRLLRERRMALELSQVQVAALVGIPQNHYSMFEVGTRRYLTPKQLEGLALALQCNPNEIKAAALTKHRGQPKTELGHFIRAKREELGLSLEQFSEQLGVKIIRVDRLETGPQRHFQRQLLHRLAEALKIEPGDLVRFVHSFNKETQSSLGRLVRNQRTKLGMSLKDVAKQLGISHQAVFCIEHGRMPLNRNNERLKNLAAVLKLEYAELLEVRSERRMKMPTNETTLGGFLTARRVEKGLSQVILAEKVQINTASIGAYEQNRKIPTVEVMRRLEAALECKVPNELVTVIPERPRRGAKLGRRPQAVKGQADPKHAAVLGSIIALLGTPESTEEDIHATALKLLRWTLEKKKDGWAVQLAKDGRVVELEILF